MDLSLSAILLTYNEEVNLPHALRSLHGWCKPIWVVDSGSTDSTIQIAKGYGAEVVVHPFQTHAKQWNWALQTLPIQSDWILALDADQRIGEELKTEIVRVLPNTPPDVDGFYLPRKQFFRGRWIRYGGYWPKFMLKLFRRGRAWCDEQELVDFRFYVHGKTCYLHHPMIESNEKENRIRFWLEKHLRFIELRADEEYRRRHEKIDWMIRPSLFGNPDQRVLWLKQLWYRLPPLVRPFLYFPYRYGLLLGFLDGRQGALFHFLHAFWYELMVSVRLRELERERREDPSSS
jgi:glycosyltransferase involved in cell wall biosynthesis